MLNSIRPRLLNACRLISRIDIVKALLCLILSWVLVLGVMLSLSAPVMLFSKIMLACCMALSHVYCGSKVVVRASASKRRNGAFWVVWSLSLVFYLFYSFNFESMPSWILAVGGTPIIIAESRTK